jgi:hypothetical protein
MLLVDALSSASQLKQYMYCDMTPQSRNSSWLGNGSVNTSPQKRRRATTEERCFLWGPSRGYKTRIPGEPKWELRKSVESWALRREVRRNGNEIFASCSREWDEFDSRPRRLTILKSDENAWKGRTHAKENTFLSEWLANSCKGNGLCGQASDAA